MDFIEEHPILFIALLFAGLAMLIYVVVHAERNERRTTPCHEYENSRLQHIPVRCYDDLKINKGCFHVEEHHIGKTTTYSVTPLCNK